MNYQIGDRVEVLRNYMGARIQGLTAIVLGESDNLFHNLALVFEDEILGITSGQKHTCKGRGPVGYCWNVPESYVKPAEEEGLPTRTPVERKCRKLWNQSRFVQQHKHLAY